MDVMDSNSKCLACSANKLIDIFDFGNLPLTDVYLENKQKSERLKPLSLATQLCINCFHFQLAEFHDMSQIYKEYIYNSSVTNGLDRNFAGYASWLSYMAPGSNLSLLDVGSNDGSFALACKNLGMKVTGIEPSVQVAALANKRGINTVCGFLGDALTSKVLENQKFNVISFNNVLANISDPKNFIDLAQKHLADDGVISIQTGYHPHQFINGNFDYIYHEHYSYFTISSMKELAKRCNLSLVAYQFVSTRAGSIRFLLKPIKAAYFEIETPDFDKKFNSLEAFNLLKSNIVWNRDRLTHTLKTLRSKGPIVMYGASHSTGVLTSVLGLEEFIDVIVDDNESKHGLYSPVEKLKVKPSSWLDTAQFEAIIVGAWQHYGVIEKKLLNRGVDKKKIIHPFTQVNSIYT